MKREPTKALLFIRKKYSLYNEIYYFLKGEFIMAKLIEIHPEAIKANRQARKEAREKRKAEGGEKKLGIGAKIAIVGSCVAAGAAGTLAVIKLCGSKGPEALMDEYPVEPAYAEVPVPEVVEETNIEVGEV